MDLEYLLFLQNFRNSINDALTPFMQFVTVFAVNYLIFFAVYYYWRVNKRDGLFVLVSYYICIAINPLIKLTACVYRPWIRDSRIIPAGDAIKTATGYSFPSGHTSTAGPLAGGMAAVLWKNPKMRWASVCFIIFVLLTGFSRNYLGVHTPQDVCVGLLISVLSIYLAGKLFAYLDVHPENENKILLGCAVFICLSLVYITFKPYPMDYTSEGKLLVDPQKMMNDGYGDLGKGLGFIIGYFIEKTWIRFKPFKGGTRYTLVCLAGLIPMYYLKKYLSPAIVGVLGGHWGKLLFSIIYACYYIALVPFVLKKLQVWLADPEKSTPVA